MTNLPKELNAEGFAIVQENTEGAASEIRLKYPGKHSIPRHGTWPQQTTSGNLRDRVKTSYPSSTILIGTVKSTAPHAGLYEFGTQTRHTDSGATRGASPPHPVTVPTARKYRRKMETELIAMVQRHGLETSGG
jgi:phage gpG-like protein